MRFTLGHAPADPGYLNRPVIDRIVNGRLVTIEIVGVGGVQFPARALESAISQFRTYLAGTLRVIEPDEMACSLDADRSMTRETLNDLLTSRKHKMPSDIALVVLPKMSGQQRPGEATLQADGSYVVVIRADNVDRSCPLLCSRWRWWRNVILHELCHCLGVPAEPRHACYEVGRGYHCTHPGCVLYPRVDARSLITAILRCGPPRGLCSACRSEIRRAHEKMAGELLEPDLPYEALDYYNQLVDLNPGQASALIQRAQFYHECGDYESAIGDLSTALSITPRYPKYAALIGNRAALYQLTGDIKTAVAEYERCLELEPENAVALANLSLVLSTCSDDTVRDSRRALDLALRAFGAVSEDKDWALAALAAAYAELGDFEKAEEAQSQALSLAGGESLHAKAEHLESYRYGRPRREPEFRHA